MSADLKSLDSMLRERARKKLRESLNSAAKPLRDVLNFKNVKFKGQNTQVVLSQILEAIFEDRQKRAEEEEIAEFLGKVDHLETEIQDLRDSVASE